MMKRTKLFAARLAIVAALTAALAGCTLQAKGPQPAPELLEPAKQKVDLHTVQRGTITRTVQGIGTFVPREIRFVSFTMDGTVRDVRVKPGDAVRPGDVLATLRTEEYETNLLERQLDPEKQIAEFEQAKQSGDPERIRIAQMNLDVTRAQLDLLSKKLDRARLAAERGGIVAFVEPDLKPLAKAAAFQPVVGIADPEAPVLKYVVKTSSDLNGVRTGMAAEIVVGGKTYPAKIVQSPETAPITTDPKESEENSRTLLAQPEAPIPDVSFGQLGELRVVVEEKKDVIVIPTIGLRSYQDRYFVHVMEGESRKEIDVEKGLQTATEVEIKKGLKEGQQIILNN